MRLYETLRHEKIGLDGEPVHNQVAAGRQPADVDEVCRVVAVVYHDPLPRRYLVAELRRQLVMRRGAVQSRRHEDRDVGGRIAGAYLGQHLRHDHAARYRTRMVGGDDYNLPLPGRKLP